ISRAFEQHLAPRLHGAFNASVGLRMLALHGGCDRLYFGAGCFNRDSRSEPADAVRGTIAAVFLIIGGGHRLPDFRIDGKAEARRHYAYDGHALAVNSH